MQNSTTLAETYISGGIYLPVPTMVVSKPGLYFNCENVFKMLEYIFCYIKKQDLLYAIIFATSITFICGFITSLAVMSLVEEKNNTVFSFLQLYLPLMFVHSLDHRYQLMLHLELTPALDTVEEALGL